MDFFFFFSILLFLSLAFKSPHLMSFLIGVEMVGLYLLSFFFFLFFWLYFDFFLLLMFMGVMACESAVGLVLFVLFSRFFSKDYIYSLAVLKF